MCATVVAAAIARGSLGGIDSGSYVAAWVIVSFVLLALALGLREVWSRRLLDGRMALQRAVPGVVASFAVVGYVTAAALLLWHSACDKPSCLDPSDAPAESRDEAL